VYIAGQMPPNEGRVKWSFN